jgi:hypothetical protein
MSERAAAHTQINSCTHNRFGNLHIKQNSGELMGVGGGLN